MSNYTAQQGVKLPIKQQHKEAEIWSSSSPGRVVKDPTFLVSVPQAGMLLSGRAHAQHGQYSGFQGEHCSEALHQREHCNEALH